ncbi:MAG: sigma-70 family RNA polymerase sigma factor [Bryobacterales bacterium]|nr:sigma-70 family RNA polymerase sigma factor [Bryobacterales bacterium]
MESNFASKSELTAILQRVRAGDLDAKAELWPLVMDELRRMAAAQLRNERTGHTLQPTALVNEVFLRMSGGQEMEWKSRAHFFAIASKAMRHILVDHARGQGRVKRGGEWQRVELENGIAYSPEKSWQLVALDEALDQLTEWDQRQSDIVEMRFFGGLTEAEVAEAMGISSRTVKREWLFAKTWLWDRISA